MNIEFGDLHIVRRPERDQVQPVFERGEQRDFHARREDCGRVRPHVDYNRHAFDVTRGKHRLVDDRLMSHVHAVELSDGDRGWAVNFGFAVRRQDFSQAAPTPGR